MIITRLHEIEFNPITMRKTQHLRIHINKFLHKTATQVGWLFLVCARGARVCAAIVRVCGRACACARIKESVGTVTFLDVTVPTDTYNHIDYVEHPPPNIPLSEAKSIKRSAIKT